MKFALIFAVWNAQADTLDSFVLLDALTGPECISALESFSGLSSHGLVACKIDGATQ